MPSRAAARKLAALIIANGGGLEPRRTEVESALDAAIRNSRMVLNRLVSDLERTGAGREWGTSRVTIAAYELDTLISFAEASKGARHND